MATRDDRGIPTQAVAVAVPFKQRLEAMRDGKQSALGNTRTVSLSEVIGDLLAEHDKATEANPI